jgi:GT2 family glycosyltransferase
MMDSASPSVIGIVTSCKRPRLVRRLLESLKDAGLIRKVILNDNGADDETEALCRTAPVPVQYHRPERNLGCGGGIGQALMLGLREDGVTHFCIFDDDAVAMPGAVATLVQGMQAAAAEVAVPLVTDAQGHVNWFPGLRQRDAWSTIRRPHLLPEQYQAACGLDPVPFTWAPWPIMALTPQVVRECGYPRDDFWFYVEDLEYSLRLTHRHRGVLVPGAVCRHMPPASSGGDGLEGSHYLRFCLLLQNLSYICTRLPHARRALRHLPGNYLRFLRTFGFNRSTVRDSWLAWWLGAVRGRPAGIPGGDSFKQRLLMLSA